MATRKKRKIPRWLQILWGGFNAGVIMGIVDSLMVMFFGLARFDRTGEIVGFMIWDAVGLGFLGVFTSTIVFFGLSYPLRSHPRILSFINLILLLSISTSLTLANLGWSFRTVRGTASPVAPNVLMLTLDTLRSDSTGFGGHPFVRTPNMDRLARKGRQFLNAVCPVPMTTPSHASMLTSTIPAVHGATENRYRLDASNETLTSILRNAGYRTAAFVSCFPLDRRFGLNRDFMLYHDRFSVPGDLRQASWFLALSNLRNSNRMERNCRWTNSLALPWIRKYTGDHIPFFLWIHYFDPHSPYSPPIHEQNYYRNRVTTLYKSYPDDFALENAQKAVRFTDAPAIPGRPEELYLGEISEMDRAIGELFHQFAVSGVMDNTIIAALADHGESFGEHGFFYTHGEDIYEPALSIPMVLYSATSIVTPGLDPRLACASDIASTILPAIGLPKGDQMEGYDLLSRTIHRRSALVENFGIIMNSRATKQRGIRTNEFKMILHPENSETKLFDLQHDPGEKRDVSLEWPDLSQRLIEQIETGFSDVAARKKDAFEDLSSETLEKLKALGYMVPGQ